MTITKLKAKNQVTLPHAIVKRLNLKRDELFEVGVEKNFIKLTPVKVEPVYTEEELKVIEKVFQKEKGLAKGFKTKKEFLEYIKKSAK
jgi:antitoxin component of MazEF toxin-antitoxin module